MRERTCSVVCDIYSVVCVIKTCFIPLKRLLTSTYESMHKHIIQSSVTTQTTHNSTHIYTSTTQHTIVNTIMSTKSTDNTLQTSIVKCPIRAMSIQIAFENSIRCTSERIEKLSTLVSDTHCHPMSTSAHSPRL